MRKISGLLVCLSALICGWARASEVIKLGASDRFAVVSHPETGSWRADDTVCLYRGALEVACGRVVKATRTAAVVKIVTKRETPEIGDAVKRSSPTRVTESPSGAAKGARRGSASSEDPDWKNSQDLPFQGSRTSEDDAYEEDLPRRRGRGQKRRGKRDVALMEDNVETKAYLYDQLVKQGPDSTLYSVDITAGATAGFNHLYPLLHFQFAIADRVALGIEPYFFSSSVEDASVQGLGGFLTFNYYGQAAYRGLWAHVGFGGLRFSANVPGSQESAFVLSAIGTVGWRQRWDLGINVGAGLGIQYVFTPNLNLVNVEFRGVQPLFVVDFGINF